MSEACAHRYLKASPRQHLCEEERGCPMPLCIARFNALPDVMRRWLGRRGLFTWRHARRHRGIMRALYRNGRPAAIIRGGMILAMLLVKRQSLKLTCAERVAGFAKRDAAYFATLGFHFLKPAMIS